MRIECHECEHRECFDCPVAMESETVLYAMGGSVEVQNDERKVNQ